MLQVKKVDNLRNFLKNQIGKCYSVRKFKSAIDNGFVKVNGVVEKLSTRKLNIGDSVLVDMNQLNSNIGLKYDLGRVLYNDDDILVYNKPAHISTMGCGLLEVLRKEYPDLIPVHRLDVVTTGAIIFVHNVEAEKVILKQFVEHQVGKTYCAMVKGSFSKSDGVVDNYLGKGHNQHGNIVMKLDRKKGQRAITEWRLIKQGPKNALVECYPKTGRTHQIRVHMRQLGHPLLGDSIYNQAPSNLSRSMLHSYKVTFTHPINGEVMLFQAPLPSDFKACMREFL